MIVIHGAYNLVYTTRSYFTVILIWRCIGILIGSILCWYQDAPQMKSIIAPVNLPALTPAGTATTIDNTNALRMHYRVVMMR